MKIELSGVKINNSFSEETLCFQASIRVNGKKVGTASNDGHGGCCSWDFDNRDVEKQVTDYIKSLPAEEITVTNGNKFMHQPTLDSILSDLAEDAFQEKEKKRIALKLKNFRAKSLKEGFPIIVQVTRGNGFEWRAIKNVEYKQVLAQKLNISIDLIKEV